MIYREKDFGPTLCHINPNHDPRNGQFASGHGSIGGASQKPTKKSSKIMSESTKKKIKTGAGMAHR